MWATLIFVEFIMHFWYMFVNTPRCLNKLRNALRKFIRGEHHAFWCSLVMCEMLVKLVLPNYVFAT